MVKTRTMQLDDGSCEIVRILDDHLLERWRRENPLAFERSIVWLQPVESLDFVRVTTVKNARSRRGPLLASGDVVILGYSKLTPDAPVHPETQAYSRRLFYLKEDDFQLNMNQFPDGAIDPRSVLPGVFGEQPDLAEVERGYPWWRCRGGLSSQNASPIEGQQTSGENALAR